MHKYLIKGALFAVLGSALLGGCASYEDVQKAQATANQAQATANQALDAAQKAQQSADQANAGVNALGQKVQGIQDQVDALKARPPRGQRG